MRVVFQFGRFSGGYSFVFIFELAKKKLTVVKRDPSAPISSLKSDASMFTAPILHVLAMRR